MLESQLTRKFLMSKEPQKGSQKIQTSSQVIGFNFYSSDFLPWWTDVLSTYGDSKAVPICPVNIKVGTQGTNAFPPSSSPLTAQSWTSLRTDMKFSIIRWRTDGATTERKKTKERSDFPNLCFPLELSCSLVRNNPLWVFVKILHFLFLTEVPPRLGRWLCGHRTWYLRWRRELDSRDPRKVGCGSIHL